MLIKVPLVSRKQKYRFRILTTLIGVREHLKLWYKTIINPATSRGRVFYVWEGGKMKHTDKKTVLILFLCGMIPAAWVGLLAAPYAGGACSTCLHIRIRCSQIHFIPPR